MTPGITAALASTALAVAPLPATWFKGGNLTVFSSDGYSAPAADRTLETLRRDGANQVSVNVSSCYMLAPSATTIDCSGTGDSTRPGTPTDASIAHAMAKARTLGLQVWLRPLVDVLSPTGPVYRGYLSPSSWSEWWVSYRAMILHYAQLAQTNRATTFVVGVELDSTHTCSTCAAQWNSLIDAVRGVFHGKTLYSANYGAANSFPAWSKLDYAGIDGYYQLALPASSGGVASPPIPALVAAWRNFRDENGQLHHWVDDLQALSHSIGKPVLFTEFGYVNAAYTAYQPYSTQPSATNDPYAQANAYEALFRGLSPLPAWFRGTIAWDYQADRTPTANDIDFDPRAKPAEQVLRAWYTAQSGGRHQPSARRPVAATRLRVAKRQHGRFVRFKVTVAKDLSMVSARASARLGRRRHTFAVGSLARQRVRHGVRTFRVRLTKRALRASHKPHSVALTLKLKITGPGRSTTAFRAQLRVLNP